LDLLHITYLMGANFERSLRLTAKSIIAANSSVK
jgi:hypothetical protein